MLEMKISEAIRKGSAWTQQCMGRFAERDDSEAVIELEWKSSPTNTCAFGAAAHAMLGQEATVGEITWKGREIQRYMLMNGAGPEMEQVVDKNNDGDWTREQCADYLEERGW